MNCLLHRNDKFFIVHNKCSKIKLQIVSDECCWTELIYTFLYVDINLSFSCKFRSSSKPTNQILMRYRKWRYEKCARQIQTALSR
jgi:hypothetical protein